MSDQYAGVIDVGGAMWAATTAPSRLPNTHKVVPIDAIVTLPSERRSLPEVTADLGVKVVPADAIVIEPGDLFEVRPDGSVVVEGHGPNGDYTYWADGDEDPMKAARAYLSIAVSQAARVDEAQVEALTEIVRAVGGPTLGGGSTPLPEDFAARLYRSGVRVEMKPGVES